MTSKLSAEVSKLLLLAHGRLLFMLKSCSFERPTEQFQHRNLIDRCFFHLRGMRGLQKPQGEQYSYNFNEEASIAASKLNRITKMLWAGRDNDKMMLEVILKAWGEKKSKNSFFLIEKHKILI